MKKMRLSCVFVSLLLLLFVATYAVPQTPPHENTLNGSWHIKFTFAGRSEMNLIFNANEKSVGTLLLLDTAPDSKPELSPRPAAWLQTTNDRFGLSGEVELPIGTCCRETGTLVFKGKFASNNSISGKVVFIGSTEEEENPIGFRAMVGTFVATRER